ncbi:MAG: hypothetical protein DLM59_10785 [Pseudonocardiales bacterium]|nr:MAG: hypothetical protein DLM59_10785 [Pseudonocardiales bacterium]
MGHSPCREEEGARSRPAGASRFVQCTRDRAATKTPSTGLPLSTDERPPPRAYPTAQHSCRVIRILARAGMVATAGWLCSAALLAAPAGAATWQWPLPGRPVVVRGFLPPATPYGAGHRGVDLAGRPGLPVLAAGAGVVGYAGVLAGRGVVTVLHERGLRTTYEPVLVSVTAGQPVAAGAVLGRLAAGHPGCPVAACLHWGLLRGETYLDPLALLGLGQVRLLPLSGVAGVDGGRVTQNRRNGAPGNRPSPVVLAWPVSAGGGRRLGRGLRRRPGRRWVSAGRTSSSAAGGPPWCASGRFGSRSRRAPDRSRPG